MRTALAQWEDALGGAFAPTPILAHIRLDRDPHSNAEEIALFVTVDRPGPEARRTLDRVIDGGLPPEAETHFDEIDIALFAA